MIHQKIEDDEQGLPLQQNSFGQFTDLEQLTKICFQVCQRLKPRD